MSSPHHRDHRGDEVYFEQSFEEKSFDSLGYIFSVTGYWLQREKYLCYDYEGW